MTKDEYIGMKNSNNYNLTFFYQYYVDNIDKARDKKVRSFAEFEQNFPQWHMSRVMHSDAMVERCKDYFDQKFGITNINQNYDTTSKHTGTPPNSFDGSVFR